MKSINSNVFESLKLVLKQRGLNYVDLAGRMGMSEAGIKKIMMLEDCSISKLADICDAIGFNIHDLWQIANLAQPEMLQFTKEQEKEFLKNESLYFFFRALINMNFDTKLITDKFSLSDKQTFSYLRKLESINLIELHNDNKIKPLFDPEAGILNSQKLGHLNARTVHKDFFNYTLKKFQQNFTSTEMGAYSSFSLREESAKDLKNSLTDLLNEFSKRSKREKILHTKETLLTIHSLVYLAVGFNEYDSYEIKQ